MSNSAWQRWVLDYGRDSQRALLARRGLEDMNPLRLIGLLSLIVAIMMALYIVASRVRPLSDPVQRAYLEFCRKLARAGVTRAPHETAADFAQRAAQRLPQHARALQDIADSYNMLRYAARPAVVLEEFVRKVRELKVI